MARRGGSRLALAKMSRKMRAPVSDSAENASLSERFRKGALKASMLTGHPVTFSLAVAVVVMWAATGPIFNFSEGWQLVINTGTTIVTFLMVFLIQATQNRDTVAIQLKLDELIRASESATNKAVAAEELTEGELRELKDYIRKERKA
jgi:low affinity Fe/Cu permease